MRTSRNLLIIITIGLMIAILFYMDFDNLSWTNNRSDFIGLFTGFMLIANIILFNRDDKKKANH